MFYNIYGSKKPGIFWKNSGFLMGNKYRDLLQCFYFSIFTFNGCKRVAFLVLR
jgi:hypothetical protein